VFSGILRPNLRVSAHQKASKRRQVEHCHHMQAQRVQGVLRQGFRAFVWVFKADICRRSGQEIVQKRTMLVRLGNGNLERPGCSQISSNHPLNSQNLTGSKASAVRSTSGPAKKQSAPVPDFRWAGPDPISIGFKFYVVADRAMIAPATIWCWGPLGCL
jgi:hypothetical protein